MSSSTGSKPAPIPDNEEKRLEALHALCVLDTPPEPAFENLTALACSLFQAPIVLISLVDEHRQFFKSVVGLSVTETSRDVSFCAYTLLTDEPLIVPDARLDERFVGNPLVTGEPYIRFYAGAPLITQSGMKLGTFCIIDREPRNSFSDEEYGTLLRFAALAVELIEQRVWPQKAAQLEEQTANQDVLIHEVLERSTDGFVLLKKDWEIVFLNTHAKRFIEGGCDSLHRRLEEVCPENESSAQVWPLLRQAMEQRIPTSYEGHWRGGVVVDLRVLPMKEGIALFFRDITDRKDMELSLQVSEQRFRHLVRSSAELVWIACPTEPSRDGSQEWREFTGQRFEDMERFGWLEPVHPEDRVKTEEAWKIATETKAPYIVEHRLRRHDGVYRSMRAHAVPMLNSDGTVREWIGVHTDVTERDAMAMELRQANERFVLATEATTEGIWDMDCLTKEMYYSARWRALLGLPEQETRGTVQDWFGRVHEGDKERLRNLWMSIQQSRDESFELELRCRHEDESWRWILVRGICKRDAQNQLLRITGSSSDITAKKTLDPLTGLHNRASLLENLQWRIDQQKEKGRPFALCFLDVDSFKRVNDSMGHLKGDALLVEIGRRLEKAMVGAPGSLVARLGGDEFVVLLNEIDIEDDALTYARAVQYLLKTPVNCGETKVFVSVSIGIAVGYPGTYSKANQVLEDADVAMYDAKMSGKARTSIFKNTMRQAAMSRLQMESDLRVAIKEGQFELHYQPKVRLQERTVKGFEALLRWRHPVHGMISPMEFIPVAEETGMITEIGRWVLQEALRQLVRWRDQKLVVPHATMAVNISVRQFQDEGLQDFILQQLRETNLPAQSLALEITESALIEDAAAAAQILKQMVSRGIGLDLDDFGTGYSSLSYLHRFPFRSVKIDQSFIRRMSKEPESGKLVASIIQLAKSLNMGVIAEGVETLEQAEHLMEIGCNVGQGYFFSRPMPATELETYLREMLAQYVDMKHTPRNSVDAVM